MNNSQLDEKAAQVLISDLITERLNTALNKEKETSAVQETVTVAEEPESKLEH